MIDSLELFTAEFNTLVVIEKSSRCDLTCIISIEYLSIKMLLFKYLGDNIEYYYIKENI